MFSDKLKQWWFKLSKIRAENLEQVILFFAYSMLIFCFLFTNLITIKQFSPQFIPLHNKLEQLTWKNVKSSKNEWA